MGGIFFLRWTMMASSAISFVSPLTRWWRLILDDDDNDDDDVSVGIGGEFVSGGFDVAVSSLSLSFLSFLPLVIGNCNAAVVIILPRQCWRDADERCSFLRRTMMALSAVLFVSPLIGFGAPQMGVVITTDDDGSVRCPVGSLLFVGSINGAPGRIIPSTILDGGCFSWLLFFAPSFGLRSLCTVSLLD